MEKYPENLAQANTQSSIPPKPKLSKKIWFAFILVDIIIFLIAFYTLTDSSTQKS